MRSEPPRVLIGGVGYRWMRDASFGLSVSDALAQDTWPGEVSVEDLGYGAVYVALDLADRRPLLERLVLVAAVPRGREPGGLFCTRWTPVETDDDDVQARIRDAGGGVVDLDHLLVIAQRFGALPREVYCLELEPVDSGGGDGLTDVAAARLGEACALARTLALGDRNTEEDRPAVIRSEARDRGAPTRRDPSSLRPSG